MNQFWPTLFRLPQISWNLNFKREVETPTQRFGFQRPTLFNCIVHFHVLYFFHPVVHRFRIPWNSSYSCYNSRDESWVIIHHSLQVSQLIHSSAVARSASVTFVSRSLGVGRSEHGTETGGGAASSGIPERACLVLQQLQDQMNLHGLDACFCSCVGIFAVNVIFV